MPFIHSSCNCQPLVHDNEFEISDEDALAALVAKLIVGQHVHVNQIIRQLGGGDFPVPASEYDGAIAKLTCKTEVDIIKRDGWVFQMISWLALLNEKKRTNFLCQIPHDAPAQHGLDGVGIILDDKKVLLEIIITEDKCTTKHRTRIPEVWVEFAEFEKGMHDRKVVSRVSGLLEKAGGAEIVSVNGNSLYEKALRKYRLGINRTRTYQDLKGRKKLFKGYDKCILGDTPHRRYAATILREDVRAWMQDFCEKVIEVLQTSKS